jgi:hypothetical protein
MALVPATNNGSNNKTNNSGHISHIKTSDKDRHYTTAQAGIFNGTAQYLVPHQATEHATASSSSSSPSSRRHRLGPNGLGSLAEYPRAETYRRIRHHLVSCFQIGD